MYRQLLTSHPTLRILFVVSGRPWEATQLRDRIARGLDPAAAQRVVFVGFQPRASLLQLMSACDLMLDTLHWSGGNTTLDALRAGLPVLTTRGRFMRGRQSAAMLTQLGLEKELVCSIDEVVARVLSLLDSAELETLRARIAIGFNALVDGSDALQALSTAVVEALQLPFAATNPRSGLPPS